MAKKIEQLDNNIIYEAIITTYNEDQTINAAVMGISLTLLGEWIIRPFRGTDTQKNIQRNKECVINFTLDPEIFVLCALFQEELSADLFYPSSHVKAPILKECKNDHCAVKVVKIDETDPLKVVFYCKQIYGQINTEKPHVFTRAFSSLVEILIHATRILAFKDQPNKEEEINHLYELIDHHSGIITRVTQNDSYYRRLLDKITMKLNKEK